MSFIRNYYPILLESLLFVCMLSLFEYIMYYLILAPDNVKTIQNKISKDISKQLNKNTELNQEELLQYLRDNPVIAQMVYAYIESGQGSNLSNTGYRYYLQQLDQIMADENANRRIGVTILIVFLFLLLFIFVLYGRYIIMAKFSMWAIFTSIAITFIFIVMMQLYFIYIVTPKLKMVNDKSIERAIYEFLLKQQQEIKQ